MNNNKNNRPALTANERKAIEAVKKSVSAVFEVERFMLFGSKARGDAAPDSDVDLLIITGRDLIRNEKHKISSLVLKANLEYETNISMVVVDKETWESELWSCVPLRQNVEEEGIAV